MWGPVQIKLTKSSHNRGGWRCCTRGEDDAQEEPIFLGKLDEVAKIRKVFEGIKAGISFGAPDWVFDSEHSVEFVKLQDEEVAICDVFTKSGDPPVQCAIHRLGEPNKWNPWGSECSSSAQVCSIQDTSEGSKEEDPQYDSDWGWGAWPKKDNLKDVLKDEFIWYPEEDCACNYL